MKKVVRASVLDPERSNDANYMTYTRNGQRFGVHLYDENPLEPKFQISEIHPYDDAEYTWARCGFKGCAYVEFINSGKIIDGMQWNYYDEEDYEDPTEYINEIIDQTCVELLAFNKDVESHMIYN